MLRGVRRHVVIVGEPVIAVLIFLFVTLAITAPWPDLPPQPGERI
jgi:hypothetical protein